MNWDFEYETEAILRFIAPAVFNFNHNNGQELKLYAVAVRFPAITTMAKPQGQRFISLQDVDMTFQINNFL